MLLARRADTTDPCTRSILLSTSSVGRLSQSSSLSTFLTAAMCSSACGLPASTTCSSSLAWRASSSVALKEAMRWCGRSRMKPTVSLSRTRPQSDSRHCRVRVSSVENSLSSTRDAGAGQRVHQRALAGVGVADQRDGVLLAAAGAPRVPCGPARLDEPLLQIANSQTDQPAVLFELRFAGAAQADAALSSATGGSTSSQARQGIFELGQFDLQPRFDGAGPAGEDVEDQFAAVEHLDVEAPFPGCGPGWGTGRCRR